MYNQTMELDLVTKRKEALTHATEWMNTAAWKNQDTRSCVISFIQNVQNGNNP